MKLLFTSDLHGNINLYEALKKLSINHCPEIIILGGDHLPSISKAKKYEDLISIQKKFVKRYFHDFLKGLFEIRTLKKIFLIPGNWDLTYNYIFNELSEVVIDLSERSYKLNNGYELLGYPFVPPTPFRLKDYEKMDERVIVIQHQKNPSYITLKEKRERLIPIDPFQFFSERETIEEDLDKLIKPFNFKRAIYIMHSPPYGTLLDSIKGGIRCGSRSIRRFIEYNQPLLTLHGHIHESPIVTGSYIDQIGETISLNPGQSDFKLHAIIFELEDIRKTIYHTGF